MALRCWGGGVGGGERERVRERERERERGLVIPCLIFFLDTQLLFNRGGVCTLSKAQSRWDEGMHSIIFLKQELAQN